MQLAAWAGCPRQAGCPHAAVYSRVCGPRPLGLLPLGVVVLACIVSCHVPVGSIARALRPTLLTLAFVLLANGLVVDGSYGVQIVGPVGTCMSEKSEVTQPEDLD